MFSIKRQVQNFGYKTLDIKQYDVTFDILYFNYFFHCK